jgi:hypothetical protein
LKKYRFVAYASGWLKGPYEFLKGVVAFIWIHLYPGGLNKRHIFLPPFAIFAT